LRYLVFCCLVESYGEEQVAAVDAQDQTAVSPAQIHPQIVSALVVAAYLGEYVSLAALLNCSE